MKTPFPVALSGLHWKVWNRVRAYLAERLVKALRVSDCNRFVHFVQADGVRYVVTVHPHHSAFPKSEALYVQMLGRAERYNKIYGQGKLCGCGPGMYCDECKPAPCPSCLEPWEGKGCPVCHPENDWHRKAAAGTVDGLPCGCAAHDCPECTGGRCDLCENHVQEKHDVETCPCWACTVKRCEGGAVS